MADLLDAELIRGLARVFGELGHGSDVGLDSSGGAVANAQIVNQSLSKRSHDVTHGERFGRTPTVSEYLQKWEA